MKSKFSIPFFVLSLISIDVYSQSGNQKADTIKPAKEVLQNNTGEKNLPRQLKESQLKAAPVILKADSSAKSVGTNAKKKKSCDKSKGKKKV